MKTRMLIPTVAVLAVTLVGCSRNQIAAWFDWHAEDPEAAVEFTRQPWVREQLQHHNQPGVGDTAAIEEARIQSQAYGRCAQWYATALRAGWPANQWPTIDRVMWAESRCNPSAYNPNNNQGYGHARGLMQVMDELWAPECGLTYNELYDPYLNLVCALHVWREQGWQAWVTY